MLHRYTVGCTHCTWYRNLTRTVYHNFLYRTYEYMHFAQSLESRFFLNTATVPLPCFPKLDFFQHWKGGGGESVK
jgi:hypothetical protein